MRNFGIEILGSIGEGTFASKIFLTRRNTHESDPKNKACYDTFHSQVNFTMLKYRESFYLEGKKAGISCWPSGFHNFFPLPHGNPRLCGAANLDSCLNQDIQDERM
jgi:hypothetical protein